MTFVLLLYIRLWWQYIMGEWDWHDLALICRPPILIPRPETEELVELILASVRSSSNSADIDAQLCADSTGTVRT